MPGRPRFRCHANPPILRRKETTAALTPSGDSAREPALERPATSKALLAALKAEGIIGRAGSRRC